MIFCDIIGKKGKEHAYAVISAPDMDKAKAIFKRNYPDYTITYAKACGMNEGIILSKEDN